MEADRPAKRPREALGPLDPTRNRMSLFGLPDDNDNANDGRQSRLRRAATGAAKRMSVHLPSSRSIIRVPSFSSQTRYDRITIGFVGDSGCGKTSLLQWVHSLGSAVFKVRILANLPFHRRYSTGHYETVRDFPRDGWKMDAEAACADVPRSKLRRILPERTKTAMPSRLSTLKSTATQSRWISGTLRRNATTRPPPTTAAR